MTTPGMPVPTSGTTPTVLLDRDRRAERWLWAKGLLALAVTATVAYLRYRWWM